MKIKFTLFSTLCLWEGGKYLNNELRKDSGRRGIINFKRINIKNKKFFCILLIAILLSSWVCSSPFIFASEIQTKRDISNSAVTSLTATYDEIYNGENIKVRVEFDEMRENIQSGDTITVSWPTANEGDVYFTGYVKSFSLNIQNIDVGDVVITKNNATITFNESVNNLEEVSGWAEFELQGRNLTNTFEEDNKTATITSGSKNVYVSIIKSASDTERVEADIFSDKNISDSKTITVYLDDKDDSGQYFYYDESGKKHIVYCYEHNKIQPTVQGTEGYVKRNFYDNDVKSPTAPVTKDDMQALLWMGYPWDGTGFQSKYNDSKARYNTQQVVWSFVKGEVYNLSAPTNTYLYDLHYYIKNKNSPYYGKKGYSGEVQLPSSLLFNKKEDGKFRTDNIRVNGTYDGPVRFNVQYDNLKMYDAVTKKVITEVKTGSEIYFEYTGNENTNHAIDVGYEYVNQYNMFLLEPPDGQKQSLIELECENETGKIQLLFEKQDKISVGVTKEWVGKEKESVTINLLADGTKVKSEVLNSDNNWKFTFTELDKYKDGHEIVYTVSEEEIAGYDTEITGNMTDGFKIVNYEKPDLTISKEVTGEAGDKTKQFNFEILFKTKGSGVDYTPVNGSFDYIGSIADGQQGVSKPVDGELNFVDGRAVITLSHGQQITIKDLPYNVMYEVIEKEANTDNYITTYNGENKSSATGELKQNTEVRIVNNKEFIPPTGISNTTDQGMLVGVLTVIGMSMFMIWVLLHLRKGMKR